MNNNNLKREILINIINEHKNDDKTTLLLLKKEIENHKYYEDKRFMPELEYNMQWRQDFLKEEAKNRIKQGDVWFAYKNLFELIFVSNPVLYGSNKYFKNESDKNNHESYYKDGFICEKEKNIIMEIINAIEENKGNDLIKMANQKMNYLKLGENIFELKENKSSLSIKYDDKNFISINIDISFEDGEYNDLDVSPNIEINNIKTSTNKLDDLKGILFEINDVNESYDRGDSFYLYESEPFIKYKIEILEINEQNVHIKLNGVGITDGYSKPYKTENFTIDAIIPIRIYNNNSNMSKEENKITKKEPKKDKIKTIVGLGLYGLIIGLVGIMLLMQFINQNNIIHLIISILMILVSLFLLYSALYEIFNNGRNKNQRKSISKSVKNMLSEDIYNKLKKLYIEELDIIFFEKENIDAGQYGFRYDNLHDEVINEWPGNEYVIIGYDSTAGFGPEPYIMKTDEKELPIYWLMTDGGDWKNPDKIANSFNDFIKIIDCLNKNLNSNNNPNKELILKEIATINLNNNMEYWKILLNHLQLPLDFKQNTSNPKFELVINEYKKLTEKECYNVNLTEEEPGILDNKIGGKPYLPIGEKYPIDKFGNPMELLLQINLNDIQLEGWPKEGILEIFISLEEDDYEYNCAIKLFKENLEYQTTFPEITTSYPTVKKGYKIKLTKDICHMPMSDNRFNDTLWSIIERVYNIKKDYLTPLYKIFGNAKWNDELTSSINNHLVTIGGYPEFVDAPLYDEDNDKIEILFKLDPNINPSNFDIIQDKILNIIIYKDDILSLNFDNIKINY